MTFCPLFIIFCPVWGLITMLMLGEIIGVIPGEMPGVIPGLMLGLMA